VTWLLTRLVVWPVRLVLGTGAVATSAVTGTVAGSARLGYRVGRLVGYRQLLVLLLGVGVGLLLAPVPGRELRARLGARLQPTGSLETAALARQGGVVSQATPEGASDAEPEPAAWPDLPPPAATEGPAEEPVEGRSVDEAAAAWPTSDDEEQRIADFLGADDDDGPAPPAP
jgi:hypothetical protein